MAQRLRRQQMCGPGCFGSQAQHHPGIPVGVLGELIDSLEVAGVRKSGGDELRGSQYGGFGTPSFQEPRGLGRASQSQHTDSKLGDVGVVDLVLLAALGWQLAPSDQRLPRHA
ncbi:hypothetical protein D9M69_493600 [compost metagenome]